MSLHKILTIIVGVLSIIGIIFALMIMTGNDGVIDNMIYVTYAMLLLILGLVLIFVVKGLFQGDIKKTLLSVGTFVVILAVAYGMSSGTDLNLTPFLDKGMDVTEATSRYVGAGLYAFYILAIVAVASMVYANVKKLIN